MAESSDPSAQPASQNQPNFPNAPAQAPELQFLDERKSMSDAAEAVVQRVNEADMAAQRGVSVWMYAIGIILLLFILAMFLLTAVVSAP